MSLPTEIIQRILSYVDDLHTLTVCAKTNSVMRSLSYAPKEKLLYRLYPSIWILLRCFNASKRAFADCSVVQRQDPIYRSLRKYLGIPKRHVVYVVEDGVEVELSNVPKDTFIKNNPMSDIEMAQRHMKSGVDQLYMFTEVVEREPSLLQHLWVWKWFLHNNMGGRLLIKWTRFLFSGVPSEIFRMLWKAYKWPFVDVEWYWTLFRLQGADVLWLLSEFPGFELYLDRVKYFDPLLLSLDIDIASWNWRSFASNVSLAYFVEFPHLPWDNYWLANNPNIPITNLLVGGRMSFEMVLTAKNPFQLALHDVDMALISKNLLSCTRIVLRHELLLSCFRYRRFNFIKENRQFFKYPPMDLQSLVTRVFELGEI